MSTIAALTVTEPGKLGVEERPLPLCGPGEVLVAPRRVGICGTDYHIFEGNHPFLQYPRIMGHELAVDVVEAPAGSPVEIGATYIVNPYVSCGTCVACRKGKPNCCTRIAVLGVHRDGGMARLLTLPAANLVPADGLGVDECAMVEFLAIGAHAARRAAVSSNDTVLVIGAGPIGLGAALFAALSGGQVTIMDRDQERLEAAQRLIPRVTPLLASEVETLKTVAPDGFDVVFDATGSRASIENGFQFVAHGGHYALVSIVKGDITFVDADFHRKEMTLLGCRNALRVDFERVIAAIKTGDAKASDWITHRTTLHDAVRDLPHWATNKTGLIKAVIHMD